MPRGVYLRTEEAKRNMRGRHTKGEFQKGHKINLGRKHKEKITRKRGGGEIKYNKKEYRKRAKEKLKNNLKYRISSRISLGIWQSLKKGIKNFRHWESLVGYTVEQLKRHLKSTMPDDYCWNDFLNGDLHIDHIIPISVFNFNKPEDLDFKRCWALSNLRLLPAKENYSKKDKLIKPFQIGLKIAI